MKKISVKDIVEFRGKTATGKKNMAIAIKLNKTKNKEGSGGDYWISCLSAVSNSYRSNTLQHIIDKKDELEEKHKKIQHKITKDMYKRNIDILSSYESFDLRKWKPAKKIQLLKKHKDQSILTIKGLDVQVSPHHVFSFQTNGIAEIGAIWFIAKLNGFQENELGMFADGLYQYLNTHYSNNYTINTKYCIAVDLFKNIEVNYSQLQNGKISAILDSTLDEIKRLI